MFITVNQQDGKKGYGSRPEFSRSGIRRFAARCRSSITGCSVRARVLGKTLSQSDRIRAGGGAEGQPSGFACARQRRERGRDCKALADERGPNGAHTGGGGRRQRSRACTVGRAALLGSLVLARRRLSPCPRARRRVCGSPRARVGWPFGPGSKLIASKIGSGSFGALGPPGPKGGAVV